MSEPSEPTPFAVPTLETARLFLRAHEPTLDAPGVFAMRTHPEGTRYLSMLPPASIDEVRARLERVSAESARGEMLGWTVTLREGRTFAGLVGIVRIDRRDLRAELAYELAHEHWGRGLMREAVSSVIEYAFRELGLHRLEIHTAVHNARSQRVAQSLGFTREGLLRGNARHALGHYEDTAVFGRLVTDVFPAIIQAE